VTRRSSWLASTFVVIPVEQIENSSNGCPACADAGHGTFTVNGVAHQDPACAHVAPAR
jgi:hypothetical protein